MSGNSWTVTLFYSSDTVPNAKQHGKSTKLQTQKSKVQQPVCKLNDPCWEVIEAAHAGICCPTKEHTEGQPSSHRSTVWPNSQLHYKQPQLVSYHTTECTDHQTVGVSNEHICSAHKCFTSKLTSRVSWRFMWVFLWLLFRRKVSALLNTDTE